MFEESNFTGALAEFRRAHAIAPSYRLLYNIGQVCYLLRDYPCALDSFSRYLSQGGAEIPAGAQGRGAAGPRAAARPGRPGCAS